MGFAKAELLMIKEESLGANNGCVMLYVVDKVWSLTPKLLWRVLFGHKASQRLKEELT